jgi:hypothetical protein
VGPSVWRACFRAWTPYLEFRSPWPDFHNGLIAEIRNELGARLPDSYVARVDERIEVVIPGFEPPSSFRPEVLVGRLVEGGSSSPATGEKAATAVLEPELMEVVRQDPEELRLTWVEIRTLPALDLVTVIEVLSPINKSWQGRGLYLQKREKLHAAHVNLVEIDLLLGGAPLPMKPRIEPGGYYTIAVRGARFPLADVCRWTVRDPLPVLPIPLREPDADIRIDLAALVTRVYDLGRYARTLRREPPLPDTASLNPDDRTWVESIVQHGGHG